jgi:futalosine hydrolase
MSKDFSANPSAPVRGFIRDIGDVTASEKRMIGVMSSVRDEGKLLAKRLKQKVSLSGRTVFRGTIEGKKVVYIISGMGKTNAAHAATVLIEKFSPDLVVLFGVGGAYPSAGLKVGDIAVAEEEIYGDEGVHDKNGFHGTEFIGIHLLKKGGKKYFNKFALDRRAIRKAQDSLALSPLPFPPIESGAFVTVSTCTGTRKRALELEKRFNAICENMEGASVAHICALYGRPMIEIRGISNMVQDRDKSAWDVKLAAGNCQRAVLEILKTGPDVA